MAQSTPTNVLLIVSAINFIVFFLTNSSQHSMRKYVVDVVVVLFMSSMLHVVFLMSFIMHLVLFYELYNASGSFDELYNACGSLL